MILFTLWIVLVLNVAAGLHCAISAVNEKGVESVASVISLFVHVVVSVVLYHIVIHGGFNL